LTNTIWRVPRSDRRGQQRAPDQNLHWTLAHINQINAAQLERMKARWHVCGRASVGRHQRRDHARGFGDGAYDMPPLAALQNSGIMWGLGTDGTAANQTLPSSRVLRGHRQDGPAA
jgi:predicted amidohydrolase YtcJ